MGRGDNRHSHKMKMRVAQKKKKARLKRRTDAAKKTAKK
jgi:hypothetical protein